ncbi:MAG: hypothetical protein J6S71_03555 [Clostridia bacterium]|nr:hypothetical protein [Clostridia bacterium]
MAQPLLFTVKTEHRKNPFYDHQNKNLKIFTKKYHFSALFFKKGIDKAEII